MTRLLIAALATLSGIALADDTPKPPSTGKELAPERVSTTEEAHAAEARRIIASRDCTGKVEELSTALATAAEALTMPERIAGNVLLQGCAEKSHSYHATIQASAFLLDHAPEQTNGEYLVDAELGLGDEAAAVKMLNMIAKAIPAQRGNLAAATSMIACHEFDFLKCFNASGKQLEYLAKTGSGTPDNVYANRLFHMSSAAALGKYDVFEADMKAMEAHAAGNPGMLAAIRTVIDQAHQAQLFVQVMHASSLALGTYHLIAGGKIKNTLDNSDALVTLRMVNQAKKARAVKVTVEVPGVTEQMTETVILPAGVQLNKLLSPPLKIDFDIAKLRSPRTSQVAVRITDQVTNASLLDKTMPVDILPRDSLPLYRRVGGDDIRQTLEYSAAWITPNAPEIDAFIKSAKARLGEHDSFSGEQQGTVAQVKALFDQLKEHGVSYVSDPSLFNEHGAVQRTRLPAEVLASTNAQCLEGTLLYATLLEAIGLRPVMVFISGHVFIAWHPSRYDHTAEPLLFLETTMTGGKATFEQASAVAGREYAEQLQESQFELGVAHLIDLRTLRRAGYTPQPS